MEKFNNTLVLIWTTTPWTLPSNLAICVNPELKYLLLLSNIDNEKYIISKDCLKTYFKDESKYTILFEFFGK